jgi:hypothetical protein
MTLDWQVLIVAFVAISLQIMASITYCRADPQRMSERERSTRKSLSPKTNPVKPGVHWR